MKKINNPFAGGKVVNYRSTREYFVPSIGTVTFKIDKNLAIYEINPRKYNGHDVLSVVRGQVPDAGFNSLINFIDKWNAEDARWSN